MKHACIAAFVLLGGVFSSAFAQPSLNKHMDKGVQCAACHDDVAKLSQGPVRPPATATCLTCHGPMAAVVERTRHLEVDAKHLDRKTGITHVKKARTNPHDGFHFGTQLDCVECHSEHGKSVNECAGCHDVEMWGGRAIP